MPYRATRAAAVACALVVVNPMEAQGKPHQLSGMASFYSKGQRTASGERFNRDAFTAAHRTIPFGTLVRVVNRRNGRSASVRINDRGPFRRGRVVDVSRAAANKLGMVRSGVVPVRLEIGLTVAELRGALAKLHSLTVARKEVRDSVRDRPHANQTHEADSSELSTARMREIIAEMIRHEDARAVAMIEAEPPPSRSLFADIALRGLGDIIRKPLEFLESLLRPIGNCRAFETVDPITRRVVADVAKELNGTALAFSCFRDATHNRRVGGARLSQHLRRKALDFRVVADGKAVPPKLIALAARRHPLMKKIGGIGTYCGMAVHVDSGPKRDWNWGCGKKRTRLAYRKQHRS